MPFWQIIERVEIYMWQCSGKIRAIELERDARQMIGSERRGIVRPNTSASERQNDKEQGARNSALKYKLKCKQQYGRKIGRAEYF